MEGITPKYYVSKVTGNKYPRYHPEYNNHENGVIRYCNFGSGDRGQIKDLPVDEYPFTIEYDENQKLELWK